MVVRRLSPGVLHNPIIDDILFRSRINCFLLGKRTSSKLSYCLFKTIYKKDELDEVIQWAQLALLNPNQDYRSFIPGSGSLAQRGMKVFLAEHKNEADFAPNVVAINLV